MVIAAIVIVIMSKGIPKIPIAPSTVAAAKKLGVMAINETLTYLKRARNISMTPTKTAPIVSI